MFRSECKTHTHMYQKFLPPTHSPPNSSIPCVFFSPSSEFMCILFHLTCVMVHFPGVLYRLRPAFLAKGKAASAPELSPEITLREVDRCAHVCSLGIRRKRQASRDRHRLRIRITRHSQHCLVFMFFGVRRHRARSRASSRTAAWCATGEPVVRTDLL